MKSLSSITTVEAHRIAKRLYNHWKHKFEVTEEAVTEHDHLFQIHMPDALLSLFTSADQLKIEIETERDDYTFLEQVVLDHLNRMAQQQFEVEWQHWVE